MILGANPRNTVWKHQIFSARAFGARGMRILGGLKRALQRDDLEVKTTDYVVKPQIFSARTCGARVMCTVGEICKSGLELGDFGRETHRILCENIKFSRSRLRRSQYMHSGGFLKVL